MTSVPSELSIGLFGLFGTGNAGNDATGRVLFDYLSDRHPDIRIGLVTYTTDPAAQQPRAPISVCLWPGRSGAASSRPGRAVEIARGLVGAWFALRRFDAILIAGGGVFESEGSATSDGVSGQLTLLLLALHGARRGRHLAMVGVGGTKMSTRLRRSLFVATARLAEYRSFRDERSKSALIDMGGALLSDPVGADVVLYREGRGDTRLSLDGERARRLAVGVMAFPWLARSDGKLVADHGYVAELSKAVTTLADDGWLVTLFGGDRADVAVIDAVLAKVGSLALEADVVGRVTAVRSTSFDAIERELAASDIVVCSRYHNAIAALLNRKPIVAIAGRMKLSDLMSKAGLDDFIIGSTTLSCDEVVAAVERASVNRSALSARMADVLDALSDDARVILRDADDLLREWSIDKAALG